MKIGDYLIQRGKHDEELAKIAENKTETTNESEVNTDEDNTEIHD